MNTDSLTATQDGSAKVERPSQDASVHFEVGATAIRGRVHRGPLLCLSNFDTNIMGIERREAATELVRRANLAEKLAGALEINACGCVGWDALIAEIEKVYERYDGSYLGLNALRGIAAIQKAALADFQEGRR